ncbi:MAG: IS66 family insertion sequence element accessory protein TnpB [Planctomycetes bacterium]|nr:IS66 family insertion sequence element accessory protein TnpB [Planctomycetota bacterium]
MLSLSARQKIFLCREPVDFRKAHDGLVAIVRDELGADVFCGDLFVFLNKRRDRVKLLVWDQNGLWLHYKRLERGTFRWVVCEEAKKIALSRADLSMLLEGIDLKAGKIRPHFADVISIDGRGEEQEARGSAARRRRAHRTTRGSR